MNEFMFELVWSIGTLVIGLIITIALMIKLRNIKEAIEADLVGVIDNVMTLPTEDEENENGNENSGDPAHNEGV